MNKESRRKIGAVAMKWTICRIMSKVKDEGA